MDGLRSGAELTEANLLAELARLDAVYFKVRVGSTRLELIARRILAQPIPLEALHLAEGEDLPIEYDHRLHPDHWKVEAG